MKEEEKMDSLRKTVDFIQEAEKGFENFRNNIPQLRSTLHGMLHTLDDMENNLMSLPVEATPNEVSTNKEQLVLDTPIENFGLSVRTLNCVKRAGVKTVWELTTFTEIDLFRLKNFGQKSLDEIAEKLAEFDLQLKPDPSEEMIKILETRIQDLGLSHKMSGFLRSRGIQTVEELIRRTPKQILHEIVNKLAEFGLQLEPDPPDTNK